MKGCFKLVQINRKLNEFRKFSHNIDQLISEDLASTSFDDFSFSPKAEKYTPYKVTIEFFKNIAFFKI